MELNKKQYLYVGVGAIAVLLTLYPLVDGKYVFLLDHINGPGWNSYRTDLFGFRVPTFGGASLLRYAKAILTALVGSSFAYSIYYTVILSFLFFSGSLLTRHRVTTKIYASLLFLINPFVYTRLLVGHWFVLWGLATLPLVLKTYTKYLDKGGYRNLLFAVTALSLLAFSAHLLFAMSFLVVFISIYKYTSSRDYTTIKRTFLITGFTVPVNAYWLGPVFFSGRKGIPKITSADKIIYAPETDSFNAIYSIASMKGFWRGGIEYATDLTPIVGILFVPILFLAVNGFITNYNDSERGYIVKALATGWLVGVLLGAGNSGPAAPVYTWLFENIPFFAGMRDSNKFVSLIILAYAYLGALGLSDILDSIPDIPLSQFHLSDLHSSDCRLGIRRLAPWILVLALLLTPIIYSYPMVTGYNDQINSQDYPKEWYEVKEQVESQEDQFNVLFLPWHMYMDYSWLETDRKRITTPARAFFKKPIIQGDNVEAGPVYSSSSNPISQYIQSIFRSGHNPEQKNVSNIGELLTHINVEYIVLTKEADWNQYDVILRNQSDLQLVMQNDMFRVYRNDYNTDQAYAVNEVRYVEDRQAFVNRSQTENTTKAVYIFDSKLAGQTKKLGETTRVPVEVDQIHPAKYQILEQQTPLTVFTQQQAMYADDWQLKDTEPTYHHIGFIPVYRGNGGGTITHRAFYRLYLPSYAVSLLTIIVLFSYALVRRRHEFSRSDTID